VAVGPEPRQVEQTPPQVAAQLATPGLPEEAPTRQIQPVVARLAELAQVADLARALARLAAAPPRELERAGNLETRSIAAGLNHGCRFSVFRAYDRNEAGFFHDTRIQVLQPNPALGRFDDATKAMS
jgi:hypothetical protein